MQSTHRPGFSSFLAGSSPVSSKPNPRGAQRRDVVEQAPLGRILTKPGGEQGTRSRVGTGLESVADARLGGEVARAAGLRLELLADRRQVDAQVVRLPLVLR